MVVLGQRTKAHKSLSSVQLDYIIHIHEVKPWPPSPSLRTLRSLLIHWEHGDSSTSGFTNQVVPASDGRIEFNESFGLKKVRLMREVTTYQNKCVVEFNLYEPRHDMGLKGQLLGSAVLDLAAYGVIKEDLSISIPIHCKRTYRNSAQPLLLLKIEAVEVSTSTRERLMREASMERNHGESVSALMSEEYAEEADVASFTTDDDVSSHSSLAVTSGTSPPLNKKKETAGLNGSGGGGKVGRVPHQSEEQEATESSSMDLSSDIAWISKRIKSHSLHSSSLGGTDKRQSSINEHHKEEERIEENETRRNHEKYVEEEGREVEDEALKDYPQVSMQKRVSLGNGVASSTKESVLSLTNFGSTRRNHYATETSRGLISSERKDAKASRKETRNLVSEGRIQQLEHRIKILEGELREAAGLEVSLYSVVAEHGSSMNKVHAPARRLSRLYFNANKHNPKSWRESASKSVVSGLVSVAKACGNDVPRLTFWLSNTIVLRAIISSKSTGDSQIENSSGRGITGMGRGGEKNVKKKWESLSFPSKITRGEKQKENVEAFVGALEKTEAWIFSRIIESLWWQTFTPRMQSGASIDCNTSKLYRRTSSSIKQQQQQQQGNFSVELWKKAFRDACERICPVRGGGHDCGCLPLLSKLIMEQVVARLDVAMLNGILRESGDEIPTDPVADPISDANVLPIPAGKASFGAGAHLKNAIGNWSRWLSDLFDMDDENKNENEDSSSSSSSLSSKSPFYLLNALSELMMLPKDMLSTPSIRKQVCPTFGLPLLTRILNSFVPDEFCPDPIPGTLLQALNSQDLEEKESMSIVNLPCEAAPIVYKAPSSVATILALGGPCKLARSGSSILNKSQTSDDELDQLDSPLKAVILRDTPTSTSPSPSVRYQLLRQVWNDD